MHIRCYLFIVCCCSQHGRIQRGDRGSGPPPCWKITKIQGILAILVRIPWKITKLPSQHSMLAHHRPTSETPLKWRFASWTDAGPLIVVFGWIFYSLVNFVKVGPPLTKLSGSAHAQCVWNFILLILVLNVLRSSAIILLRGEGWLFCFISGLVNMCLSLFCVFSSRC